jgi:5-formyltetrahydrofolate cyclo-ligase
LGLKSDLRLKLKRELSSISDLEYEKKSQLVSKNLNALLNRLDVIQQHLLIGVFAPIEKEPKWFLQIEEAFKKLTAYPAFANDSGMVFKLAQMSDLKMSQDFGAAILGPEDSSPIVTPKIIIVPGLGFSSNGLRLGRGKGFYDRYLENKSVIKIGIAFEMQIEKDIPTDPHDVKMDFVVTDQQIYKVI